MSKNLIPEIAKLLGVEIGEEFKIDKVSGRYRFYENNLEILSETDNDWHAKYNYYLLLLISGKFKIVKLPWKPKYTEEYWTFVREKFLVTQSAWENTAIDFARLKCGMVFRTEAEAIKERPRIYKELTGKDWSD